MPPENTDTDGGVQSTGEADSKAPDASTETPETVPLTAHTALRTRAQTAETELANLKAANKKATDEAAEKQGEFQKLYGISKPKADAYDAFVVKTTARNTARVEKIPAEWKDVVPSNMDAMDLQVWLDTFESKINKVDEKRPAGTVTGGGGTNEDALPPMPDKAKEDAKSAGMSPEDWWAKMHKAKRYQTK